MQGFPVWFTWFPTPNPKEEDLGAFQGAGGEGWIQHSISMEHNSIIFKIVTSSLDTFYTAF